MDFNWWFCYSKTRFWTDFAQSLFVLIIWLFPTHSIASKFGILPCVIQVRCACTFPPVANMAARRSGNLLFQRCVFCSREARKLNRDFDARRFSRVWNTFVVSSGRSGSFLTSGENLRFISSQYRAWLSLKKYNDDVVMTFVKGVSYDFSSHAEDKSFICWSCFLAWSTIPHLGWVEWLRKVGNVIYIISAFHVLLKKVVAH